MWKIIGIWLKAWSRAILSFIDLVCLFLVGNQLFNIGLAQMSVPNVMTDTANTMVVFAAPLSLLFFDSLGAKIDLKIFKRITWIGTAAFIIVGIVISPIGILFFDFGSRVFWSFYVIGLMVLIGGAFCIVYAIDEAIYFIRSSVQSKKSKNA